MTMPVLETARLRMRPLARADLDAAVRILDIELEGVGPAGVPAAREERQAWLEWAVRNEPALASLHQPPYGDRAVALRSSGEMIGLAGFAPVLAPLGQLPGSGLDPREPAARRYSAEVGLYWALSPRHQHRGYATEAAAALCDYGFQVLNLRRIVATTTHDNAASQAVMRRLGMRLAANPLPEPEWFQVVGLLDFDAWHGARPRAGAGG
jgi:RimJ/RimL family protein N-acetyltransferase